MKKRIKHYVLGAILSVISMIILQRSGCNEVVAVFMGAICGTGIDTMIEYCTQ